MAKRDKYTKEYWYKQVWKGKLIFTGLDITEFNLEKYFEFSVLNLNLDTYRIMRYL